jgi:hypothetical protein
MIYPPFLEKQFTDAGKRRSGRAVEVCLSAPLIFEYA